MEKLYLLTLNTHDGYTESIAIPSTDEQTVKKAIGQINIEGYIDSHCSDWRYKDESGSYFDQVLWKDVFVYVDELKVFKS